MKNDLSLFVTLDLESVAKLAKSEADKGIAHLASGLTCVLRAATVILVIAIVWCARQLHIFPTLRPISEYSESAHVRCLCDQCTSLTPLEVH